MQNLSAIKRIEIKVSQMSGVISLAQGIPNFASSSIIQEEVIKAIKENKVDKYSPISGLLELKTLISEKLLQRGMQYSPANEIIVTAGGIEALSATMLGIVEPGDEVLYLTPAYPYYERIIRMARGKPVPVPLNEEKGWGLDLHKLRRKITHKTKALILCNPNNPTGSILSQKELMTIGILSEKHKFLIISDDIYENFYYGEKKLFSLCKEQQFRKQIIRIVSFSKDFALSGWRIGFIHSDKEQIAKILPLHDNLINCAPVVSQYAALAALRNEDKILSEYIQIYANRRKLMGDYLEKLRSYMDFIWPKGAYYFFPKILGVTDTESLCFSMLERVKVATVPGDDFGLGGKGHIRLCFGKSESDIDEGMKRLTKYFQNTAYL